MTAGAPEPIGRETGPVFISYIHRDGKEIVDFLETYLRAGGIIPWRDQRDLGDGKIESTINEAMAKGLSGGILVTTPQLAESTFVPEVEVPALLKLHGDDPDKYSFQILNTIRDPATGALDSQAPDRLLRDKLPGVELSKIKQYALLASTPEGQAAASDMELLLADLLKRRLRARREELRDKEITIGLQTRPEWSAADADKAGRNNDLTIRLIPNRTLSIPSELSYRCLQRALPKVIDAIYDADIHKVRFDGGCHVSLAWALGAALPEARPRLEQFAWLDTRDESKHVLWSSSPTDQPLTSWIECVALDVETGHPLAKCVKAPGETSTREEISQLMPTGIDDVVVLIASRADYAPEPLIDLARRLGKAAVVVVLVNSPDQWVPSAEGENLARQVGRVLRQLARSGRLHLAMSGSVAFVALVARHCNTLTIDLYEWAKPTDGRAPYYVRLLRCMSGNARPIAAVFPQGAAIPGVTQLVNLTPHDVTLYDGTATTRVRDDGVLKRWPKPSGKDRWVRRHENHDSHEPLCCDGVTIPLTRVEQGGLIGEPPERAGVGYIVPRISAAHARRPDFFFPHREVRDEDGTIIGCLGLGSFPAVSDSARPYLQYLDVIGEE